MGIQDMFRIGGWGMYPTTIFGLLTIYVGIKYAARRQSDCLSVMKGLSLLTLLSGALGFVTGCIKAFTACGNADPKDVPTFVVVGTGEAMSNIALALCSLTVAWILVTVGEARATSERR